MKTHTEYLVFNTEEKIQFVRITERIEEAVEKSGVKDGMVLVNPMHITAAVIVNDNEGGLIQDYIANLQKLVPYDAEYNHNVGEDNAAAHIWRQLMAHQVVLPITDGKLDFGPWEQVFYCEFDGGRRKRVLVKVIGE
ncbi:YjbQ family protein [Candidatus Micrarchaeota archaeon]|nr:YjbQ family protein [Candidatus Micrarchaeota archaeon]MBD3418109.1 YjbQ family protein [Candidatus Micrarchaeota archaeon]